MTILIACSCGTPQTILQHYDCAFHFSVVRHIVETSCASPIGAGSVTGTEHSVYPDLWHAFCALVYLGGVGEMMPSVYVTLIVVLGFFVPVGLCALARTLADRDVCGLVLALCMLSPFVFRFDVFEFVLFGPLLANLLGMALLPAAIAWLAFEFGCDGPAGGIGRKVLVVAACVFTTGMAHPNTVFVLLVAALCLVCAQARRRASKLAWLLVGAGVWLACLYSPFFQRTVNCLDRTTTDIDMGNLLFGALHLNYEAFAAFSVLPVLLALGFFAAFCAVAYLARKVMPASWIFAAVGFFASATLLSLFPYNPVSIAVTGFFYRDFWRLVVIVAYLAIPALIVLCACAVRSHSRHIVGKEGEGALAKARQAGAQLTETPQVGARRAETPQVGTRKAGRACSSRSSW